MRAVVERFQLRLEDLPPWDDEQASANYVAKLSRDFMRCGAGEVESQHALYLGTDRAISIDEEEEVGQEDENDGSGQGSSSKKASFNVVEHEATSPQELVCYPCWRPRVPKSIQFISDVSSMDHFGVLGRDFSRVSDNNDTP